MRRFIIFLGFLALAGAALFYVLTIPATVGAAALPGHKPDIANGRYMFFAGGCASCHAPPMGGKCDEPKYKDKFDLGGGRCLKTPFGTFFAPNISPDRESGIGGWSVAQFVTAMTRGVSPDGRHYYPAFPYTSYQRMRYEDLIDLKSFLDTLAKKKSNVPDHDLPLPFRLRRGLGLWKLLFLDGAQFKPDVTKSEILNRGAYLVEGPGHCAECHSPRNLLGGFTANARYSGGPAPEGKGFIPNITPHKQGLKAWSEKDIAYALESGFTPEFDVLGGSMTKVQENMAQLTPADRAAIAAYLKSLPPLPSRTRKKPPAKEKTPKPSPKPAS